MRILHVSFEECLEPETGKKSICISECSDAPNMRLTRFNSSRLDQVALLFAFLPSTLIFLFAKVKQPFSRKNQVFRVIFVCLHVFCRLN